MKAKESNKIAIRYAKALLESLTGNDLSDILKAIKAIALAWEEHIELRNVLLNPALGIKERSQVIDDLSKSVTNITQFSSFLNVLLENGRISALPQVADEFEKLVLTMQKTVSATVTSAVTLSDSEKQSIMNELSKYGQAGATVNWQVDPQLIGGLVIKVGDKVLDNTIRGAMDRMRQVLVAI